jgi:hypothetical protein
LACKTHNVTMRIMSSYLAFSNDLKGLGVPLISRGCTVVQYACLRRVESSTESPCSAGERPFRPHISILTSASGVKIESSAVLHSTHGGTGRSCQKTLFDSMHICVYRLSSSTLPMLALPPPRASAISCVPTTAPVLLLLKTPEME